MGNNPCSIQNENPEDGTTDVEFNPTLSAEITDANGDSVYWEIRTNAGGSWQTINSSTLIGTANARSDVTIYRLPGIVSV